jgi:hypothetical protein
MRNKKRIARFLLDEFFKYMLRHFEIGKLRQDLQLEFIGGAIAPLFGG